MATLAVGIDIGGTKTHLRICEGSAPWRTCEGSAPPRDLVLPSAEWRTRDWREDARRLTALAAELAGSGTVAALAVGAHGCDDASECAAFEAAFAEAAPWPVKVVNDAELLPAARGFAHGIGVVAGTGSIAVTRNPDGSMLVAGGWGWVIGDEGSASGLVREAGRIASHHLDAGGAASEPLVRNLCDALGIANPTRIGSAIASTGGAAALGRHAHVVFDAAERGSPLARKAIRDGAAALVELVARLKRVGAVGTSVVAGGGVIVAQSALADAFLEQIAERFGGEISAELLTGPPVEGACRLAAAMAARRPHRPVPSAMPL